jgi:hypothetical protein
MQTSRFQLWLIATLAVGLGFSLASSDAVGYPAGAAVSMGTNPVVSSGGMISDATTDAVSAPGGQVLVVTDLLLSMNNSNCSSYVTLQNSAGDIMAAAKLHSFYERVDRGSYGQAVTQSTPTIFKHSFGSGVPVQPGEALSIVESGGCQVAYTVSGYHAQP